MKLPLGKLVNVLAATGILIAAGYAACAGAYAYQTKVVRTCESAGCNGDMNKGYSYDQDCTVYCCPSDWQTWVYYYGCANRRYGGCCTVNTPAYTPNWGCPPPQDPPNYPCPLQGPGDPGVLLLQTYMEQQ